MATVKSSTQPPATLVITRGGRRVKYNLCDTSKPNDGALADGSSASTPGIEASLTAREQSDAQSVAPVYEMDRGGAKFTATGLITIRTSLKADASRLRSELDKLGFAIVRQYPNGIVVEPTKIDIATALAKVADVERLTSVTRAEPQLVAERVKKN